MATSHAPIAWMRGAPEINQTRAYLKSYSGPDLIAQGESRPSDRDPKGVI